MSVLTITDLPFDRSLDREAMQTIHGGGGAPWVYGWITPYVPSQPSMTPVVNLYEISNTFYAGQMTNQFQNIDINNTGANSRIVANPNELSSTRA
jgi:hypothetical protein